MSEPAAIEPAVEPTKVVVSPRISPRSGTPPPSAHYFKKGHQGRRKDAAGHYLCYYYTMFGKRTPEYVRKIAAAEPGDQLHCGSRGKRAVTCFMVEAARVHVLAMDGDIGAIRLIHDQTVGKPMQPVAVDMVVQQGESRSDELKRLALSDPNVRERLKQLADALANDGNPN